MKRVSEERWVCVYIAVLMSSPGHICAPWEEKKSVIGSLEPYKVDAAYKTSVNLRFYALIQCIDNYLESIWPNCLFFL